MSLQAAIEAELPRLRAEAEARMTSRVIVRRLADRDQQDEETGEEAAYWQVVYTDLPFRLVGGETRRVVIGDVEYQEATARGDMPSDTTNLADDDLLEVTSGEWTGSVYRIVEAVKGDQRTARRVPVVEVDRPEEW